jgi:tetratricopeptide (TPR) repeat protein
MTTRKKPARRGPPKRSRTAGPARLPDRRLMEQQMAIIGRLLEGHEFGSVEEANAFLHEVIGDSGGMLPAVAPQTPLEQAQELIYQALETSGSRRLKLARQALAISPECADAYVLLAEAASDPHEACRLYEQGVQAGERALGPEVFAEDVGHFWGILETRPYMRAREGLAEVLWHLGERERAIAHLRDMLRLNPGDNQGVRYTLATWLLEVGNDAELEQLLDQYPDDISATWPYTRALACFRHSGAGRQANAALKRAVQANPFVPLYLLGARPLPKQLPAYVGIGDTDEAVAYVAQAGLAWLNTPGATDWMAEVLSRPAAPPNLTRLPRRQSR